MSEYDYDKLGQGQELLATKKTQESTIAFLSQVPGKGKSTGYPLNIDFDGTAGGEFISRKLMAILPMGTRRSVGGKDCCQSGQTLERWQGGRSI